MSKRKREDSDDGIEEKEVSAAPVLANASDNLDIKPLPTNANKHVVPPLMDQINLKHPFSLSIIGNTGSGKTVLCLNLVTNPQMYGGYFDEIHLFGLTVESDNTWDILKLPKRQIHSKPNSLIPELRTLLDKQKRDVEVMGVHRVKKICIIFEDATANRKLLNSSEYIEAYVQNRHYGCTTIAMCHKYHAQTRVCRLNSNHIMVFPCTMTEVKRIISELQPAHLSAREFQDQIAFCFKPDETSKHPFLWLNFKVPDAERVRKTLRLILD